MHYTYDVFDQFGRIRASHTDQKMADSIAAANTDWFVKKTCVPNTDQYFESVEKENKPQKKFIGVVQAYGRNKKNKRDIIKDWKDGLDFQITDMQDHGRYLSIRDFTGQSESVSITCRYNNNMGLVALPIPE